MWIASFATVDLLNDVSVGHMQLPPAAPFLTKHLPVLAMQLRLREQIRVKINADELGVQKT